MTVYRVIGRSQLYKIDFTVSTFDNREAAEECKTHMDAKDTGVLGKTIYTVVPTPVFSTFEESWIIK